MGYVRLQREPFSADSVRRELTTARVGGVTVYVGTVRGDDDGRRIEALEYEAYPEMAERQLEALRRETIERFGLVDATVIHRLGRLHAGEDILLAAFAGAHRKETFAAVDYFMDRLKAIIPIWKEEQTATGRRWILGEARHEVTP
jgi:molybdopterin synthase catalytic subunit